MLPPSWKREIEKSVEETADRDRQERQAAERDQGAVIAGPLAAINNQLEASNQRQERIDKIKKWFDGTTAIFF
jgi:hypothetical protein